MCEISFFTRLRSLHTHKYSMLNVHLIVCLSIILILNDGNKRKENKNKMESPAQ